LPAFLSQLQQWVRVRFQNATFFSPFTRLWELAAGGLLAMGAVPNVMGPAIRNALAVAGMTLIVGSVFLIHATMPFPGLLALPAVTGACLIILAGRADESIVGRLLSLRPVTFIGAISYSLYLWHWPINCFQHNYGFMGSGLSSGANKILIVAVSIAVAALSWKLIEQPFRVSQRRPSKRLLLKLASFATASLIRTAAIATAENGLPTRFSQLELDTVTHLTLVTNATWRAHKCFLFDGRVDVKLAPECLAVSHEQKNYLLLGDSHAAELWMGFHTVFDRVHWLQTSASGCLPTIVYQITEVAICTSVVDDVMRLLLDEHIDNVVLAARWKPSALDNVAATLDWMNQNHIHVTLIGPTALYDMPVPRLVISAMRASEPALLWRHLDPSMTILDAQMKDLAQAHHIDYISLLKLECTGVPCSDDPAHTWPELFDQEHFNELGSKLIAMKVRDAYIGFGR
jgi:hypothetical protein